MKKFTVELWAQQDLGHVEEVTLPDDIVIDPNDRNTLCLLSRLIVKYTNGSRTPDSKYQKRPLSNGDVVRVGQRRFCILSPKRQVDFKVPQEVDVEDYFVLELGRV